jgi:hypothetical protein
MLQSGFLSQAKMATNQGSFVLECLKQGISDVRIFCQLIAQRELPSLGGASYMEGTC